MHTNIYKDIYDNSFVMLHAYAPQARVRWVLGGMCVFACFFSNAFDPLCFDPNIIKQNPHPPFRVRHPPSGPNR